MRRRPSTGSLIALLALIVALGGTATAARNAITGRDVRNGSLTGADVKPGSLTGKHIRNRSVGPADIAPNAVRGRHIRNGSVGRADLHPSQRAGAGPAGPAGVVDLNKITVVQGATATVVDGQTVTVSATCPAGQKVTGGGFSATRPIAAAAFPRSDGTGYTAILTNDIGIPVDASAQAVCVAP